MNSFTKRPSRSEDFESLHSGEIEVVRVVPSAPAPSRTADRFPRPPADRPRVFSRQVMDDERTTLMPPKSSARSGPGATSSRVRPFVHVRADDDEMTVMRPNPSRTGPLPVPSSGSLANPRRGAPSSSSPMAPLGPFPASSMALPGAPSVARSMGPVPMSSPYMGPATHAPIQVPAPPSSMAPMTMRNGAPSEARAMEAPAAVITSRTRHILGRPTVSWTAALVAMGVFVGLVSAVVVRGDADALIDATASFVDPSSHGATRTAAAATSSPLATVNTPPPAMAQIPYGALPGTLPSTPPPAYASPVSNAPVVPVAIPAVPSTTGLTGSASPHAAMALGRGSSASAFAPVASAPKPERTVSTSDLPRAADPSTEREERTASGAASARAPAPRRSSYSAPRVASRPAAPPPAAAPRRPSGGSAMDEARRAAALAEKQLGDSL